MPWKSSQKSSGKVNLQTFRATVSQGLEQQDLHIHEALLDLIVTEAAMKSYIAKQKKKGADALQTEYVNKQFKLEKDKRWQAAMTKCAEQYPDLMEPLPADCVSHEVDLLEKSASLFQKYVEVHGVPGERSDCVSMIGDSAISLNVDFVVQKKTELKPSWTTMEDDVVLDFASTVLSERLAVLQEYIGHDQPSLSLMKSIKEAKTASDKVQIFKSSQLEYLDVVGLDITSWGWTFRIAVFADRFAGHLAKRIQSGDPKTLADHVARECLLLSWLCSQVLVELGLSASVVVDNFEGHQISLVERTFKERRATDVNFAKSLQKPTDDKSVPSDLLRILGEIAEKIERGMCPETFKRLYKSLKWSFFNGTFSKLHKGADTLPERWKRKINSKIDEAAAELPLEWVAAAVRRLRLNVAEQEADSGEAPCNKPDLRCDEFVVLDSELNTFTI